MSGRLNVDHRLNDKTKLSVSTSLIRSNLIEELQEMIIRL